MRWCGLLAQRLADTLKAERHGRVAATVARADKWLAQTPQMFRIGPLRQALQAAGEQVTDESSAMEAMGLQPCWCRAARATSRSLTPKTLRWPKLCCSRTPTERPRYEPAYR